jgi:chemotaxis protein CheD
VERSPDSNLIDGKVSIVPANGRLNGTGNPEIISVAIGQWAVAAAPAKVRTLLGSCVGVVLHDRVACIGGVAHVVLPHSRGVTDHPGKFADTAIPAMIEDVERLLRSKSRGRLVAKLIGGACMFQVATVANSSMNIGQLNQEAVEQILADLRIPILARELGGASGRNMTLDVATGVVSIKIPGGAEHEC